MKKKQKIVTVVTFRVLWQGMHDFYKREFAGELTPHEIVSKAKKEVVSFNFKVVQVSADTNTVKVIDSSSAEYFIGGKIYKKGREKLIVTRHCSHTSFNKGDVVLGELVSDLPESGCGGF